MAGAGVGEAAAVAGGVVAADTPLNVDDKPKKEEGIKKIRKKKKKFFI